MKYFIGTVISQKMPKTIVVELKRENVHPIYKKTVRGTSRVKVDCEKTVSVGDIVKIVSTRPLSKDKHFQIEEVIKSVAK